MRFWFGRKAAPADVRPAVPAWLGSESRTGFARDYHAQFEEVFRRNPVGQRAVGLVTGILGALPIYAVEGDERAAAIVMADGLLEGVAANLLLHGNSYAQLITGDDGAPAEICLLRPERVSVVTDECWTCRTWELVGTTFPLFMWRRASRRQVGGRCQSRSGLAARSA